MAISKIVRDLERMGDEAYKVGKLGSELSSDQPPAAALNLAASLGRQVADLVKRAVDSFVRLDADEAQGVFSEDKAIDSDYESSLRAMVTFMIEDPRSIGRMVSCCGCSARLSVWVITRPTSVNSSFMRCAAKTFVTLKSVKSIFRVLQTSERRNGPF